MELPLDHYIVNLTLNLVLYRLLFIQYTFYTDYTDSQQRVQYIIFSCANLVTVVSFYNTQSENNKVGYTTVTMMKDFAFPLSQPVGYQSLQDSYQQSTTPHINNQGRIR